MAIRAGYWPDKLRNLRQTVPGFQAAAYVVKNRDGIPGELVTESLPAAAVPAAVRIFEIGQATAEVFEKRRLNHIMLRGKRGSLIIAGDRGEGIVVLCVSAAARPGVILPLIKELTNDINPAGRTENPVGILDLLDGIIDDRFKDPGSL